MAIQMATEPTLTPDFQFKSDGRISQYLDELFNHWLHDR